MNWSNGGLARQPGPPNTHYYLVAFTHPVHGLNYVSQLGTPSLFSGSGAFAVLASVPKRRRIAHNYEVVCVKLTVNPGD